MTRRCHRIDHDRRFASLELIDGPDAGARDALLKLENLRVVGRDDEYVLEADRRLDARAVDRCRSAAQDSEIGQQKKKACEAASRSN